MKKASVLDISIDITVYFVTIIVILITVSPLLHVISMSISDPFQAARGDVYLWPKGINFGAYELIFEDKVIWRHYYNTIWYTVVGTLFNILFTLMAAYPLSRRNFHFRKFFNLMVTITLFFSGGLIPLFILVTRLGMYNSRLAIIVPGLIVTWNLLITRSYLMTLPEELMESARIEGCSELQILYKIVFPLSKPIIAVLTLYYGLGHWNSYFNALLYLSKQELQPIQIYLIRVLVQASSEVVKDYGSEFSNIAFSFFQIKYAVIIIVMLPILSLYPFMQKHFIKGIMIGALKG